VFMGRITHQKGCDLIAQAAKDILKGNPAAQASCRALLLAAWGAVGGVPAVWAGAGAAGMHMAPCRAGTFQCRCALGGASLW